MAYLMGYYSEISASLGEVFVAFVPCHLFFFVYIFSLFSSGKLDYVRYISFFGKHAIRILQIVFLFSIE